MLDTRNQYKNHANSKNSHFIAPWQCLTTKMLFYAWTMEVLLVKKSSIIFIYCQPVEINWKPFSLMEELSFFSRISWRIFRWNLCWISPPQYLCWRNDFFYPSFCGDTEDQQIFNIDKILKSTKCWCSCNSKKYWKFACFYLL